MKQKTTATDILLFFCKEKGYYRTGKKILLGYRVYMRHANFIYKNYIDKLKKAYGKKANITYDAMIARHHLSIFSLPFLSTMGYASFTYKQKNEFMDFCLRYMGREETDKYVKGLNRDGFIFNMDLYKKDMLSKHNDPSSISQTSTEWVHLNPENTIGWTIHAGQGV